MKLNVDHPSTFIPKETSDIIRSAALDAEQFQDLHPRQLELIYQQEWFKMFIPKRFGGLGYSLPEVLKTEEALSWADGSTGWVVTLCSGAGWFTGFLDPSLLKGVLLKEKLCFAGSGAISGTANITENGYEITGHWKYASGSLHATVFTANCVLHQDGRPQHSGDGTPLVRAFVFYNDEVTLHRHWDSMGMIATASHSFEVKNLKVSADRAFAIDPNHMNLKDPVFRYPFLQLAETTLSINMSGMAIRFLDLCFALFSEKMKGSVAFNDTTPDLHQLLASANEEMNERRFKFYAAVGKSWEVCVGGEAPSQQLLDEVSETSNALAHRSRQLVDGLYPYCGLIAANTQQEINRVWRNIHTASQHALFNSR